MIIKEHGTEKEFNTNTVGVEYFCDFSPCVCNHVSGWQRVYISKTNAVVHIEEELFDRLNKGERFTILQEKRNGIANNCIYIIIEFPDRIYTDVTLPIVCLHPVAKESSSSTITRFIPGRWYRLRKISGYTQERWEKDERRILLDGGAHKCVAAPVFITGGESDKKLCEYARFEGMKINNNQERGLWRLIPMGEHDLQSWEDVTERVAEGEAKKERVVVAANFDKDIIDFTKVHDGLFSQAACVMGIPIKCINPAIDSKKVTMAPYPVKDVVETKEILDKVFSSLDKVFSSQMNTRNGRRLRRRGKYAVVEPPQVMKTRNSENS